MCFTCRYVKKLFNALILKMRRCTPFNLHYPALSVYTDLEVLEGLWNCQSAFKKAYSISAYAYLQTLHFLALTETWITPENTATPAALSTAYSFSHTSRPSGRGGGTGLILPKWSYQVLPLEHLTRSTFELLAVTLPIKLYIAVIYRPPGPIRDFFNEMDALLSCFPEDGTPLIVLGDFNIQPEKLHSSKLTFSSHLTAPCVAFSLPLKSSTSLPPSPHIVTSCHNLKSLSPSTLASTVLSSLPSPEQFSLLSTEEASSTLRFSLLSSLDSLCPLTSRPAQSSPPPTWLSKSLRALETYP